MGYSSLASARAIHQSIDSAIPIAGTTRTEEKAEELADSAYRIHVFDGESPGLTLDEDLEKATHVILSCRFSALRVVSRLRTVGKHKDRVVVAEIKVRAGGAIDNRA